LFLYISYLIISQTPETTTISRHNLHNIGQRTGVLLFKVKEQKDIDIERVLIEGYISQLLEAEEYNVYSERTAFLMYDCNYPQERAELQAIYECLLLQYRNKDKHYLFTIAKKVLRQWERRTQNV
jgi:hypothetical protein